MLLVVGGRAVFDKRKIFFYHVGFGGIRWNKRKIFVYFVEKSGKPAIGAD